MFLLHIQSLALLHYRKHCLYDWNSLWLPQKWERIMAFIPPIFQAGLNKALHHYYSSQSAAPLYWDGSLSVLSLNLKCLFLSGLLEASMETPNMYIGVFCTGSVCLMCIIIGLTRRKNKTNPIFLSDSNLWIWCLTCFNAPALVPEC